MALTWEGLCEGEKSSGTQLRELPTASPCGGEARSWALRRAGQGGLKASGGVVRRGNVTWAWACYLVRGCFSRFSCSPVLEVEEGSEGVGRGVVSEFGRLSHQAMSCSGISRAGICPLGDQGGSEEDRAKGRWELVRLEPQGLQPTSLVFLIHSCNR